MSAPAAFLRRLRAGLDQGGFQTDDTLALLLPLFRQVAAAHERALVAPLEGVGALVEDETGDLVCDSTAFGRLQRNDRRIDQIQHAASRHLDVVGESNRTTDLDEGREESLSLDLGSVDDVITRPIFLPGYRAWEHGVDHHDPVTDIFCLGQLLASVACGLDFTRTDDLDLFIRHRGNLFALAPRLHPVVARVISQMTELNRHRRAPDLAQLTRTLETYRDQPLDVDLSAVRAASASDRRLLLQEHLRDRLFEISRRNRLIYFHPTQLMLNLTVASVPLVMDVKNIRLDQLFLWQPAIAADLVAGNRISLGKYLRIEDAPYLPGVLDKIIAEARRDRAEYGFAQLRLVACFLRWHNLKEAPQERIHSPLLLLPVELVKRKGVRDAYVLNAASSEAEVNPALRHHLRSLYGINLPETVDLAQTSLDELHAHLQHLIHASEPGVTLEKVERPRIELIHARARQRLNQWQKRQRPRRPAPDRGAAATVAYNYDRDDYRPKGLQLFVDLVRPQPLPLAQEVGAPPGPRVPGLLASDDAPVAPPPTVAEAAASAGDLVQENQQEMYALRDQATGNPYHWAFDLCSLTLGNFHYRKMTLVRDYTRLTEEQPLNPAFDAVFSVEPRPADEPERAPLPLREQFPVIPCDAAQAAAVARSRDGSSFIIQGPPGTGKSQTITNLIADYLARGRRVLFVCEKRAAIDVVFHRLRQQGLDELCCLIHDSQADKKTFIQNLKQTYEQWLEAAPSTDAARERDTALAVIEQDLAALGRFSTGMTSTADQVGVSTHALLQRLVELRDQLPDLAPEAIERLPPYPVWLSHGALVDCLRALLATSGADPVFAAHPFSQLSPATFDQPRPLEHLLHCLDAIEPRLDAIESRFEMAGVPEDLWSGLSRIAALIDFAHRARPLAEHQLLDLLDPRSARAITCERDLRELEAAAAEAERAHQVNHRWRDPLDPVDTINALEAAQRFVTSWARVLQPAYWRLTKTVRARHDFKAYAVEPSLVHVLTELHTEHAASANLAAREAAFAATYGSASRADFTAMLAHLRGDAPASSAAVTAAFRDHLREVEDAGELVLALADLKAELAPLQATLSEVFIDPPGEDLGELRLLLTGLRRELRTLPEFLGLLAELAASPPSLQLALRRWPLPLEQFEPAVAAKALDEIYRGDAALDRFDGRRLQAFRERIGERHLTWLHSNAVVIRDRVRALFRDHVRISAASAAQLTGEEKPFKKTYAAGRRELEHEFGKTMRYKSIRDLAAGDSGLVVRDLKPVWLMSPLSVSDTLPLDTTHFDVVIFDEASQIPVEEAVPAIYRATQVIVVGDQMQLPPTNFFSSSATQPSTDAVVAGDEDAIEDDDEMDRFEVDLEADSLLAQAARNLPSTLLAWHYRSRSESLINFSNAAFYGGNLHTIPDRGLPPAERMPLLVREAEDGAAHAGALLTRSISFHHLETGLYEHRRNPLEARYIAQLVRELLLRSGTRHSIGIVAFSEAQQTEIDRALDALADEDKDFASRLEAEVNREEDDQFCGLFIKNLENVQGDERDIIILSICYGPDRQGRMLMNFGPINQRGGEKRLNVIFSRARHHMAVVSSIRHTAITNDYNDGANALRQFLHYAESHSSGELTLARGVIESLNPLSRKALAAPDERDATLEQLTVRLRERGHAVDTHVGQSRFRCDLALRDERSGTYALGILIDTAAHYQNPSLLDRYCTRPTLLEAFGWQILLVLTKDWFHEPDAVLARIEQALHGELAAAEAELPEPPPPDAPTTPVAVAPPATAPVAPAGAPTAATAASFTQRLEYRAEGSAKFWSIEVADTCVTVRFGRIGTSGQSQQKHHPDAATARQAAAVLVDSKLRKGYHPAST